MLKRNLIIPLSIASLLLSGCQQALENTKPEQRQASAPARANVAKIFIVDCLLPGQIRKLGGQFTYLTARRALRTSAIDCEIRGGEYTTHDRADYRTALNVWLQQAQTGNAEAQANVGEIYEKGMGILPDYELARLWYEKAAANGNTRAKINLGYLYEKGFGVQQDLVKAINWYRNASGLVDDELKFASNIEIAIAASTQKEVLALKQQVSESHKQVAQLKSRLARTQSRLGHRQKQLHASLKRLRQLQANQQQWLATENRRHSAKQSQYLSEIHSLQQDINQQQSIIDNLQNELAHDKGQLNEQVLLASAVVNNDLTRLEGPSISILQQPLVLTRGLPTLKLPIGKRGIHITGRVNAPAGLLGFTVNGTKHTVGNQGKFEFFHPVNNTPGRIKMVAVDKGGRVARLAFAVEAASRLPLNKADHVQTRTFTEKIPTSVSFGNYYALVIGNNRYKHFPELKTAVNDARKVEALLRDKYGFKTRLLLNADRYTILTTLNDLSKALHSKDNLLIYYAGHGELHSDRKRGFWLPVDAETSNNANWISNLDISDILNVSKARHVLVVADSCYSGTMSSTAQARMSLGLEDNRQRNRWIKVMAKTRARIVLTSGGVKPVLDSGAGEHSVFANAFLKALKSNGSILEGYRLYQQITNQVQNSAAQYNVDQVPRYAPLKYGGGLGEFFFIPKKL